MADLLAIKDLPDGFAYPEQFVRVVELGLTNLEPWWVLNGEPLRARRSGLVQRYPTRSLVPFAARQDNDDVACWDCDRDVVSIIHDYASPGHEGVTDYPDFAAWFRAAVEDCLDWE